MAILLIDDDTTGRALSAHNLRKRGHQVDEAADGRAGLQLLDPTRHDVVVTDLRMEGMDGMALFAALNHRLPSLPVIILTAHGSIPEAVEATQADLEAHGIAGPILGHVGDGNFHAILLVDPEDVEDLARIKAASDRMVALALRLGGTSTGEHGVGVGKKGFMEQEHGAAWQVMGQIKHALDPNGLLNPGKLAPDAK